MQIPVKVQLGLTFSGKSYWISDTRVYFYTPPGIGIIQTLVLSIVRLRVIAEGPDGNPLLFFYDQPNIYHLILANTPTDAAHARITVAGLNYGTVDYSSQTKLGDSPYMFSSWTSYTSVSTRVPSGLGRALTVWEAVAGQVGYTEDILSYNEPMLSAIQPGNQIIESGLSTLSTMSGLDFVVYDTTLNFRLGSTAAENTDWTADSSVTCRIPSGFRASREISLTVNMLHGTDSTVFSFDIPNLVSLQSASNSAKQTNLKLAGSLISTFSDLTLAINVGSTACESSLWLSDSTVLCSSQAGDHRSISLYLSLAEKVSSLSQQFTFDSNVLSNPGKTNNPARSTHTMTSLRFMVSNLRNFTSNSTGPSPNISFWATGAQFGLYDASNALRCGATSAEATVWVSDSTVYAAFSDGLFSSKTLLVTSATLMAGTVTIALSFDKPVLSTIFATNAPRSGDKLSVLSGSGMGTAHFSASVRVGGCVPGFCIHGLVPSTPCTNTVWSSSSSISCRVPIGVFDGISLTLTSGMQAGSISSVFTYDEWPLINSMNNSNAPTRYGSVFMQGINLCSEYLSPHARIGFSGCEKSIWIASSAILCKVASGMDVNMPTSLTLGLNQTFRIQATACGIFSYNVPTLSSVRAPNSPTLPSLAVTMHGADFSWWDSSPNSKLGFTASTSTTWRSDTSLSLFKAVGASGSASASVTDSYQRVGTVSEIFSHDTGDLLHGTQLNTPIQLNALLLTGMNFGQNFLSLVIRIAGTSAQKTGWTSDTQCLSLQSGGTAGSIKLSLTSGLVVGTSSNLASFDLSMLLRSNRTASVLCNKSYLNSIPGISDVCESGHGNIPVLSNILVVKGILGLSDNTPSVRISVSAAQMTSWISASLVLCRPSIGIGMLLKGSVTVASRDSSLTNAFTYDPASLSSLQLANSPIRLQRVFNLTSGTAGNLDPSLQPRVSLADGPSLLMTFIRGQNYGISDMSVLSFAIGSTNCETTGWISMSAMFCRRSSGIAGSKLSVCSIAQGLGTLTQLYSFDSPLLDSSSLSQTNSPSAASTFVSFGSLLDCGRGYYFNNSLAGMLCMPCFPGSICAGTNVALPCPPGSFSSRFGMTSCAVCVEGTYQDGFGASVCKQCPLQGQNSTKGAGSVLNCSCPNSTIPMNSWFLSKGICPRNISNSTYNFSTTNISSSASYSGQSLNSSGPAIPIVVKPVWGGMGLYDYSLSRYPNLSPF